MNILQFQQVAHEPDIQSLLAYLGATIEDTSYDTSYTTAAWWSVKKPLNRKHDTRMAWGAFNVLAEAQYAAYYTWLHKYHHILLYWRDLNTLTQTLPEWEAKLTKPLREYATDRDGTYKHKNAAMVAQLTNQLAYIKRRLTEWQAVSDVPPAPDPAIDAAWERYNSILAAQAFIAAQHPPRPKAPPTPKVGWHLDVPAEARAEELTGLLAAIPKDSDVAIAGVNIAIAPLIDWLRLIPKRLVSVTVDTNGVMLLTKPQPGLVNATARFTHNRNIVTKNTIEVIK